MGKGGRRQLPTTSGRKRSTVEARQKGRQERKSREDTTGEREQRKTHSDLDGLERTIWDLRSQLDRAAKSILPKDNPLERLDKETERLQQEYNRVKQRMRQIGARLWKEGV